jgi:hypothetical protein
LSEDPLKFQGGINFYEYVKNDPVRWRDPSGWSRECLLDPKSRCAKLFEKMFHMTAAQFNRAANNIPWFYSPNANTFGNTTWNDISGNGDNSRISSSFSGTSHEAVTAAGGATGAPVVLGPDWFLDSSGRQGAVMLHEAVHSLTGWSDADVFNVFSQYGLPDADFQQFGITDAFTQWLLAGCPLK